MAIVFITPVVITPAGTSGWQDVDVSAYVPAGAVGVMLDVAGASGAWVYTGWRKNGSTDSRTGTDYSPNWSAFCGVDSSRVLELYRAAANQGTYRLIGYFGADSAVFFTNLTEKTPATAQTWCDLDLSGLVGADEPVAALFEIEEANGGKYGLRCNGSTDNHYDGTGNTVHRGAMVALDASHICEGIRQSTSGHFWVNGYIKSCATFTVNMVLQNVAMDSAWHDLSALPVNAIGGFYQVHIEFQYDMRKKGSALETWVYGLHGWRAVQCDTNRIVQLKMAAGGGGVYLIGYGRIVPDSTAVVEAPAAVSLAAPAPSAGGVQNGTVEAVRGALSVVAPSPSVEATKSPTILAIAGAVSVAAPSPSATTTRSPIILAIAGALSVAALVPEVGLIQNPVILAVPAALQVAFPCGPATAATDIALQVGAGYDDGFALGVSWDAPACSGYNLADFKNSIASPWGAYPCRGGFRFSSAPIPKEDGLVIQSAVLRLHSYSTLSGVVNLAVRGHAADNSPGFVEGDIWTRPRTAESVAWAPGAWAAGTWYDSPNISSVVAAVVGRAGWASGNALSLFVDMTETPTAGRQATAWESNHSLAPKLLVTYAIAGGPHYPLVSAEVGCLALPPAAVLQCAAPAPGVASVRAALAVVKSLAKLDVAAPMPDPAVERMAEVVCPLATLGVGMAEPITTTSGNVTQFLWPAVLQAAAPIPTLFAGVAPIIQAPAAALALAGPAPTATASRNVVTESRTSTASLSAPTPGVEATRQVALEPPVAGLSVVAQTPPAVTTGAWSLIEVPLATLAAAALEAQISAFLLPVERFLGRPTRVKILSQRSEATLRPLPSRARILNRPSEVVLIRPDPH